MPSRMSGKVHDCPVPTCPAVVPIEYAFCKPHWQAIPSREREEVWRTYREYQKFRSLETFKAYTEAKRMALKAVA